MDPLVTAVMITGKTAAHEYLAQRSIDAFRQQTWANRELLIINDGNYQLTKGEHQIREVRVPQGNTLGELRNIGLEEAKGDWIIQWDDDDWHHPERIAAQMAAAKPEHCVLLQFQLRYSFTSNCAYRYGCSVGIAGTILHPRTAARYPSKGKGEDSDFWLQNYGQRRILMCNSTEQSGAWLYVRFYHGNNTWDAGHIMRQMSNKRNIWAISAKERVILQNTLQRYVALTDAATGLKSDTDRSMLVDKSECSSGQQDAG